MRYAIIAKGDSRSFPPGDPFLAGAVDDPEVVIHLGTPPVADASKAAVLVELAGECLGVHTGEAEGEEGSNILGFAATAPTRRAR